MLEVRSIRNNEHTKFFLLIFLFGNAKAHENVITFYNWVNNIKIDLCEI
jgi:hypothetical protein